MTTNANVNCIITGVVLMDIANARAFVGDLFQMGDIYIVNCNEASEHSRATLPHKDIRWIAPTGDYFERKGVWVIHEDAARLSLAALEYIGK